MITTAEYLREKAHKEAAEEKVRELEAKVAELQATIMKLEGFTDCEPEVESESEDTPE